MNLSAPEGNAFNDFIIPEKVNKIIMSSPAIVAEKLSKLGKGTVMSKMDHKSAYKLIPTKIDHLFLQGFMWLESTM